MVRVIGAVTRVVEEERIIRFRVLDQPMHSSQDVLLGWLTHRVLLVVGQDNHILPCVSKIAVEVCRHVLDVIDATSKLAPLAKVVDAYQQSLASPCAVGVLEAVTLRGTVAKGLHGLWRWRWGIWVALNEGIGVDGRETLGR